MRPTNRVFPEKWMPPEPMLKNGSPADEDGWTRIAVSETAALLECKRVRVGKSLMMLSRENSKRAQV
jgi:hypothetical protein